MAPTRERTSRNLGRLTEIAHVAARHGFGYFLRMHLPALTTAGAAVFVPAF